MCLFLWSWLSLLLGSLSLGLRLLISTRFRGLTFTSRPRPSCLSSPRDWAVYTSSHMQQVMVIDSTSKARRSALLVVFQPWIQKLNIIFPETNPLAPKCAFLKRVFRPARRLTVTEKLRVHTQGTLCYSLLVHAMESHRYSKVTCKRGRGRTSTPPIVAKKRLGGQ